MVKKKEGYCKKYKAIIIKLKDEIKNFVKNNENVTFGKIFVNYLYIIKIFLLSKRLRRYFD